MSYISKYQKHYCPFCNNELTNIHRIEYVQKQDTNKYNHHPIKYIAESLKLRTKMVQYGRLIGLCNHCLCGITLSNKY